MEKQTTRKQQTVVSLTVCHPRHRVSSSSSFRSPASSACATTTAKVSFQSHRHVQNLPQLPLASAGLHCQIHVFMVSEHARACLQIASDKMH